MKPSRQDESEPETITVIRRFLDGDDDALALLWNRVRASASNEANRRLRRAGISPRLFDDDDATSCVLYRIHRARNRGKLAWVKGDDDFRRLFSVALRCVVLDANRRFNAGKRGGLGPAALGQKDRQDGPDHQTGGGRQGLYKIDAELDRLRSEQPSGEDAVDAIFELQGLLDQLGSADLRHILWMSHQGYSTHEIAAQLGVSPRTVGAKRAVIRRIYLRRTRRL